MFLEAGDKGCGYELVMLPKAGVSGQAAKFPFSLEFSSCCLAKLWTGVMGRTHPELATSAAEWTEVHWQ